MNTTNNQNIETKQFLITGSSSGIGLALTKLALSKGHKVIGVSKNKFLLENKNYRHKIIDQSQTYQIIELYNQLKEEGLVIDALVLNAGTISKPCGIDNITEESVNEVVDTNLKGTFYYLKYIGQFVKPETGSICLTSSIDGVIGEPYGVMYSATKAGIISLMQSFARYYGKIGIRVNSISPGLIDTPMTSDSGELSAATTDFSIIQRMGKPEEIATSMYFLLSEKSSFITGQNLIVDGGFVLK
jgi:NAD(P)-dependent dehydrogenase (short-subunit alcohol dehydrogenase family)